MKRGAVPARIHLHVEDGWAKPDVFRLTKKRVDAARRQNPDAARYVRVTYGHDLLEVDRWIGAAEALICSSDYLVDKRFPLRDLARIAPQLRWISTIGAGVDKLLPLEWMHPGIVLTNNSGVTSPKVYEFAIMALIMLNTRAPTFANLQSKRKWVEIYRPTCNQQTLAVLGTGDLGVCFAHAGQHLGMRVVGINRSGKSAVGFQKVHCVRDLIKVLAQVDVLATAAPLTKETRKLIGDRALGAMKPGAGLISFGRGAIIDSRALEKQLRRKHLSGAVLGVFEQEPLSSRSPLWKVPNLFIFPHCTSADVDEYIPRTLAQLFDNVQRFVRGEPLHNRVDPGRAY